MRLIELEPNFLRHEPKDGTVYLRYVDTLAEAQGVMFLCPVCFEKNGGPVGTHRVICWSRSRGVPEDVEPKPGRWTLDGTGYDDLTLNGDPPGGARSVLLTGLGCGWHGFITNGEVIQKSVMARTARTAQTPAKPETGGVKCVHSLTIRPNWRPS